jgi:hypothetical protein
MGKQSGNIGPLIVVVAYKRLEALLVSFYVRFEFPVEVDAQPHWPAVEQYPYSKPVSPRTR